MLCKSLKFYFNKFPFVHIFRVSQEDFEAFQHLDMVHNQRTFEVDFEDNDLELKDLTKNLKSLSNFF